jgi:hypothetical protein
MTYNEDIAPFQHTSDTSREAAESIGPIRRLNNEKVLAFIREKGDEGATIDEIAVRFATETGTASARIDDLMGMGVISKTPMRRKTRKGKPATVHIFGSWADKVLTTPVAAGLVQSYMGQPEKPEPRPDSKLEEFKKRLARTGHGHVIPRADGSKQGCGGPSICTPCRIERDYFARMEGKDA